jgi:methylated-DNA-[protein]-cysteine S-methyltransferase
MKVYYYSFKTLFGVMWLAFSKKGIVKLSFPNEGRKDIFNFLHRRFNDIVEYKENDKAYGDQINLYLAGKLKSFDVPLDLYGTEFQKRVWNELLKIPYGSVRTYKDIAESIGKPKAFRAVGGANNKNPIPIIIPCHRVIGSNGELVGYGGGLEYKIKLLQIEGIEL